MTEAAVLTTEICPSPVPTPLATALQSEHASLALRSFAGALTPRHFSSTEQELTASITEIAIADLGYRTRIRIAGSDRLRWLNGMVSNAVQTLTENHGNYNFILNAQGRIQGDAYIYRAADCLLLDTDHSQIPKLLAHLDHFIIMDDVELHPLDEATTGITLIGPESTAVLDNLGLKASVLAPLQFAETTLGGASITLVHAYRVSVPRYELWFHPEDAPFIWMTLTTAGARPVGVDSLESLRVLEGTPRYGVDITDRHLPQETSQTRALNFTKGCYLGQEIVERIRSRATVHRSVRQFDLQGDTPTIPVDLHEFENPAVIGQLTSVARIRFNECDRTVALGSVRNEVIERKSRIEYDGGVATVLENPPLPLRP